MNVIIAFFLALLRQQLESTEKSRPEWESLFKPEFFRSFLAMIKFIHSTFSLQVASLHYILGYLHLVSVTPWHQLLERLLDAYAGQASCQVTVRVIACNDSHCNHIIKSMSVIR